MIELRLEGTIPSKKNSRVNTKSGRSFPSPEFEAWQKHALAQVRQQTRQRFYVPVGIEIIFYFGTLRVADLDNKLASILDMLKEALVIRDDRWQYIPRITIQGEHRLKKPGAYIRITEIDD